MTWTRVGRMVGKDTSTELWWQPQERNKVAKYFLWLRRKNWEMISALLKNRQETMLKWHRLKSCADVVAQQLFLKPNDPGSNLVNIKVNQRVIPRFNCIEKTKKPRKAHFKKGRTDLHKQRLRETYSTRESHGQE